MSQFFHQSLLSANFWQVEEEEEPKEGEEAKPEVIDNPKCRQCMFLENITLKFLCLLSGWEEKEDNNWEVLGLGISQWNKAYMGELKP